jgi:hypothetical protein
MGTKTTTRATKPRVAGENDKKGSKATLGFAEHAMLDADQHRTACRTELERLVSQPVDASVRAGWEREAAALMPDAVRFPGPWSVLIGESYDVLRFLVNRWHARTTPGFRVERPGLAQVASRLPYSLAGEIAQLTQLASEAQRAVYLRARGDESEDARPAAEALLGELLRALTFLLDDGIEDASDAALAELRAAHDNPDVTAAKLAAALEDYAALARRHGAGLAAIGFDVSALDAVSGLVRQLRLNPAAAGRSVQAESDADLRDRRDRLATLLYSRVRRVRSAAQFVFAKYPKIVREATSAYQRQARASRRANADETEKPSA